VVPRSIPTAATILTEFSFGGFVVVVKGVGCKEACSDLLSLPGCVVFLFVWSV
jgi:hypothetical protein